MSSSGSSFSGFPDQTRKPGVEPARTYASARRGSSFLTRELKQAEALVRDKVVRAHLVPPAPHTSLLANRVAGYQHAIAEATTPVSTARTQRSESSTLSRKRRYKDRLHLVTAVSDTQVHAPMDAVLPPRVKKTRESGSHIDLQVSGVTRGKESSRSLNSQSHVASSPGQVALSVTGLDPTSSRQVEAKQPIRTTHPAGAPKCAKASRTGAPKCAKVPLAGAPKCAKVSQAGAPKCAKAFPTGAPKCAKVSQTGAPKCAKVSHRVSQINVVQKDNETCPSLAHEVALNLLKEKRSSETVGLETNESIGKPGLKKGPVCLRFDKGEEQSTSRRSSVHRSLTETDHEFTVNAVQDTQSQLFVPVGVRQEPPTGEKATSQVGSRLLYHTARGLNPVVQTSTNPDNQFISFYDQQEDLEEEDCVTEDESTAHKEASFEASNDESDADSVHPDTEEAEASCSAPLDYREEFFEPPPEGRVRISLTQQHANLRDVCYQALSTNDCPLPPLRESVSPPRCLTKRLLNEQDFQEERLTSLPHVKDLNSRLLRPLNSALIPDQRVKRPWVLVHGFFHLRSSRQPARLPSHNRLWQDIPALFSEEHAKCISDKKFQPSSPELLQTEVLVRRILDRSSQQELLLSALTVQVGKLLALAAVECEDMSLVLNGLADLNTAVLEDSGAILGNCILRRRDAALAHCPARISKKQKAALRCAPLLGETLFPQELLDELKEKELSVFEKASTEAVKLLTSSIKVASNGGYDPFKPKKSAPNKPSRGRGRGGPANRGGPQRGGATPRGKGRGRGNASNRGGAKSTKQVFSSAPSHQTSA